MNGAPVYELLWAKTGRQEASTHSLIYHMVDVAQVTAALWDTALPEGSRCYFAEKLGMDPQSARQWLAFMAGLHDLGKACPAFQMRHEPSRQLLSAKGLPFEAGRVPIKAPHGWVTAAAVRRVLQGRFGVSSAGARQIAHTVGGHHGVFPSSYDLQMLPSAAHGGPAWEAVRCDLVQALASVLAMEQVAPWSDGPLDQPAFWTLLAGVVSLADWLGSMESHFFQLSAENVADYSCAAYDQAAAALRLLGWTGWRPPKEGKSFCDLFGRAPRPMQETVVAASTHLTPPALVIIEAPTGEGKTEAALYLADHWAQTAQQRGAYVAMPTMATSNQMLRRVREFLEKRYSGGRVELLLLHGNAAWSEDMESLRLASVCGRESDTVVAHSWFLPRKRSLLAPFAVGTVDQALLSVLQTKHFFVRLFGLSRKTVVFGEVHAYDTYMSTLFQRLLRWLSAMGSTVILLSATLPDATRRELMEAYTGRAFTHRVPYPAVSWATADSEGVLPVTASSLCTRKLELEWVDAAPAALVEALRGKLVGGGCVAVVCNTVGRAQEVYRALAEAKLVPDEQLYLFHARFPFGQRQRIEDTILHRFGPGNGERPQAAIVVATQVIEQSLDLDFDSMVSDLVPVDLLLQRAGRVHRHTRPQRPSALGTPRLCLACPEARDDLPRWGNDAYVYEPYVLDRSYLALRGRALVRVPDDVQSLIGLVYDEACEPDASFLADPGVRSRLERDRAMMVEHREKDRYKACRNLIPPPDDEDILSAANRQLDEDSLELHETWQALTRLAQPSITLVCLHEHAGGLTLDAEGNVPVDLTHAPDGETVKALVDCSVKVSGLHVVRHFLAQEPPMAWRDHPMLRYWRLAVFRQGKCAMGERSLVLHPRLGLIVEREEG